MPAFKSCETSVRWAVCLALGAGLAACSGKPQPAATAPAARAVVATQAAQAAAEVAAQQQAAALAALSVDELRTRGRQALREQRIYTPAGNNAMEYYIALRKKSAKPDASAESALMDLQPYAVIAAEQAITREDFVEADRLRSLISAADAAAPSLPRITDAIAKGRQAVAARQAQEATHTVEQAKAEEAAAKLKALQAAKLAQQAALPTPAPAAPAAPAPAPTRATPPPEPVAEAPAPARQPPPQARAPASELVAISTPQPSYPAEAQRQGTSGQVVVSFVVNADGSVGNISVVSARPHGVFDKTVTNAVRRWRFQPIDSARTVTRTFSFAL